MWQEAQFAINNCLPLAGTPGLLFALSIRTKLED
jgi:hypothetical protein